MPGTAGKEMEGEAPHIRCSAGKAAPRTETGPKRVNPKTRTTTGAAVVVMAGVMTNVTVTSQKMTSRVRAVAKEDRSGMAKLCTLQTGGQTKQ